MKVFTDLYGKSKREINNLTNPFVSKKPDAFPHSDQGSYIIESMKMEDAAGFQFALDSVCQELKFLSSPFAPSIDRIRQFVQTMINKNYPCFVLKHDHRIVGWVDIIPLDKPGATHCGKLGMGIIKPFRNQGQGRKLILAALSQANIFGLTRIEIEVIRSNIAARHLYKKVGFAQEGLKQNALWLNNRFHDLVLMANLSFSQ